MNTRRMRVEIIRFGLLIIVTVALISIATRQGKDHGTTAASRSSSPSPSATSTPTSGTHTGAGSGTSTPGQGHPAQGQGRAAHGHGNASPGPGSTGQGSGTGSGAPAPTGPVAQLPRTGGAQAAELAGVAAVLIAAGSFSLTVSRRVNS